MTRNALKPTWPSAGILVILLYAFALRAWQLDSLHYTHDFGVPHGLGIRILELIAAGQWTQLPLLSFASGVALANPPAISYFWAAVAALDRDPYSAAMVSVLLNVAGVGAVYAVSRDLFTRRIALIAAFLMASSGWSAYFARGTWMQGQLEAFACFSAWLTWSGLHKRRPGRLFAAGALTALFAQTYLTAFGLAAQIGLSMLLYWPGLNTRLRRSAVTGVAMCVLSALAYAAIALPQATPDPDAMARVIARAVEPSYLLPNPFGLNLDFAGLLRSTQFVTSADFGGAVSPPLDGARAVAEIAVVIVMIIAISGCIKQLRSDPRFRLAPAWFGAPALAALIISVALPKLGIGGRQYMLLGAPAGYMLAALGMQSLWTELERRKLASLALALALVWAGVSGQRMATHAAGELSKAPDAAWFELLSLRYQRAFAQVWRAQCDRVVNPQLPLWQTSLLGGSAKAQQGRAQISGQSIVWQISATGGDCLTLTAAEPAPPGARIILRQDIADGALITYRSLPAPDDQALLTALGARTAESAQLNLGWRLIGTTAPDRAHPGESLQLTQIWRIDSLPQEAHDAWCYSLFATWRDATGKAFPVVSSVEAGPLICGRHWRAGDYIISRQAFAIPADSAPGPGLLEVTLFDARQGKNAAYVAADGSVAVAKDFAIQLAP